MEVQGSFCTAQDLHSETPLLVLGMLELVELDDLGSEKVVAVVAHEGTTILEGDLELARVGLEDGLIASRLEFTTEHRTGDTLVFVGVDHEKLVADPDETEGHVLVALASVVAEKRVRNGAFAELGGSAAERAERVRRQHAVEKIGVSVGQSQSEGSEDDAKHHQNECKLFHESSKRFIHLGREGSRSPFIR